MLLQKEYSDKKICVAISGGADSVALLHQLQAEQTSVGYRLCAVHCEHGIRGAESLADQAFVQELCRGWGIPLFLFSEDCPARAAREKTSLETAARNFRYECFSTLVREGKADYIATAHHLGDEAETVLFRLARGTSLTGVAAMRPKNGYLLRPTLYISKSQILQYIQRHGLSYREDSTNLQTDATRNEIRLEILPKLESAVAGATENIARFARLAAEDDELLYRLSAPLLSRAKEGWSVSFSEEKPLFTRACATAMKELGIRQNYSSTHLESLFALQRLERGSLLHLPQGVCAEKREKGIYFYRPTEVTFSPQAEEKTYSRNGYDGGRYEVKISSQPPTEDYDGAILRLDERKLPPTAVFRFRKVGDEIRRFGTGVKSLKKFFNEEKTPPQERGYLPLIAERDSGKVYVVCGVEISEDVRVDEGGCATYVWIRKKEK